MDIEYGWKVLYWDTFKWGNINLQDLYQLHGGNKALCAIYN